MSWFTDLCSSYASFVIWGDKLYFLGQPAELGTQQNRVTQQLSGTSIEYALSPGVDIATFEASDKLANLDHRRELAQAYINDQLSREDDEFLGMSGRYKMMTFIVNEVLPRLVGPSQDERLQARIEGRTSLTGEQILQEALGDEIVTEKKTFDVGEYTIKRLRQQLDSITIDTLFNNMEVPEEFMVQSEAAAPSLFGEVTRGVPLLVINGKPYFCTTEAEGSDLVVTIGSKSLGYNYRSVYSGRVDQVVQRAAAAHQNIEALKEIIEQMEGEQHKLAHDVEYMPLMDKDEFIFRDVGFFRNGDIYYVFKRLPKFARQSTWDENIFYPKEHDDDGYAGDLAVGLRIENGRIVFHSFGQTGGGVVYRGPIQEDAPFSFTVDILDPTLREKYGSYRTICHVGGYPDYELSADGFTQFFWYAQANFLDSFRQKFLDDHHDQPNQAALLDSGRLMTRETAEQLGYQLRNIHRVEGSRSAAAATDTGDGNE